MKYFKKLREKIPINCGWAALVCALVIYDYVSPTRVGINVLFIILSVCILDAVCFWTAKRQLRIYIDNSSISAKKHEQVSLKVSIANKGYIPSPFLLLQAKKSQRFQITGKDKVYIQAPAKMAMHHEFVYEAKFSGQDIVGIEWGVLVSYFGFFEIKMPLEMYIRGRVLPEICHIHGAGQLEAELMLIPQAQGAGQGNGKAKRSQAGDEPGYELIPYSEGDSQKLIHWKIAALKDIYLVRQREAVLFEKEDICLVVNPFQKDQGPQNAALQDKTVTTAVAVAYYFLLQKKAVSIVFYMDQRWQEMYLENVNDIIRLQEAFSRYSSMIQYEFKEEAAREISKTFVRSWHAVFVFITAFLDEDGLLAFENSMPYVRSRSAVIETGDSMIREKSDVPVWYMTDQYKIEQIN